MSTLQIWIYIVWDEKNIKKRLNLCDPRNRNEILDYLLYSNRGTIVLTNRQSYDALGFFYQYQVIVYYDSQKINTINEMCTTLHQTTSENGQIISEFHHFSVFVMNAEQRLLLKYLFRIKIRKSYLFLRMLIYAALYTADRLSKQPTDINNSYHFYTTIIHTLHFWRKRHFVFAINHGICKIIVSYMISCSNQSNAEKVDLMEINTQYFAFFAQCIDKYNLSQYYLSALAKECFSNKEQAMKVPIFFKAKEFLKQMSMDVEFTPLAIIPKIPLKCQWITCNKKEDKNRLYRCKGCKLIVYCCRNHQKKHWNSFHSRQCLRQHL